MITVKSLYIFQASSDMFLEVMRDIEAVQKESDGFLEQAKILVISHDISFQLFFIPIYFRYTTIDTLLVNQSTVGSCSLWGMRYQ